MTTFDELTDSIAASLRSYTGVQESTTWLTSPIGTGDLSIPVASVDALLVGTAEIEDELIYVHATDSTGLTLPPFGRGYRGSTAAEHATGTALTFDPTFPRREIRQRINRVIAGTHPNLYSVKTVDLTYNPVTIGYELPVDALRVLGVTWRPDGDVMEYWEPLYEFSFDPFSPEGAGKTLNLLSACSAGSTVRVVYMGSFDPLVNGSDTLADIGFPESAADVIEYGVAAHMVRFLDAARLQVESVENAARSQLVGAGDAGKVANQIYAMYAQRLLEERNKQLSLYPPSMNFQR